MYVRKLLLYLIKKMSVFFITVTLGNLYGMDRAIVAQDQSVNRKALQGFLCTSFLKTRQLYTDPLHANLSDETKEKIRKKIIDPNDNMGAMLFDIATKLPPEIQNLIALKLLNNNNNAANKFLNTPIVHAFWYPWSRKVFSGETKVFCSKHKCVKVLQMLCKESSNWKEDVIFEHAQDIIAFEAWDDLYHNRKTLESIHKVYKKFSDSLMRWDCRIGYKFYKSYTLSNFKQHQNTEQWLLLPMVIAPFLSKLILQKTYDPLSDNLFDHFGAVIPQVFGGGCSTFFIVMKLNNWLITQRFFRIVAFVSFLVGAISTISAILYEDYFQHSIESPFLGMGCAIGAYAAICSVLNVIKMRSLQDGEVLVSDIPKELQRNDIQIP